MYGKANKPGPLGTAQMICEKEETSPLDSECMSRMMTPEEWEKYGPLIFGNKKELQKISGLKFLDHTINKLSD